MSIVKTPTFWQLFLMYFCGMFFCVYNSSVFKSNANMYLSDHTLTITGSFGSLSNCVSSLVMASIMDHVSFSTVYKYAMVFQLVLSATIYQVRDSAMLYTLAVSCVGWCHGIHCSCFPAACVQIFGLKHGGQSFSFINFGA
jgi:hypothetical protein